MAGKRTPGLNIKMSNQADEQIANLIRGIAPWIVWLFVLPIGAVTLAILRSKTDAPWFLDIGLAGLTVILTKFIWKVTSSRNPGGRLHHLLNMLFSMGWLTATVHRGWQGIDDPGVIVYALGGMGLCLAWNIRYTTHSDPIMDVLPRDDSGYGKRRKQPRYFDGKAVVRIAAARAPVVRRAAESAGNVFPVLKAPWQQPAITAPGEQQALPAPSPEDDVDVEKAVLALQKNWKNYTTHKNPQLNGARMRIRDAKPWRVKTVVIGVRGVHVPKMIEESRDYLASQMALPQSSIITQPHPGDGSRVYLDFVLHNVLKEVRHWPGPTAVGKSIGEAPTVIGVYEDRMQAELLEAAVSETLAKKLGIAPKNLSHLIGEGMTGSGKSNVARITITDGATRLDVTEWVIDTVKKYQTLGCCAGAIDWFAVKVNEAQALVRFLVKVIGARANYLGMHGYDNWEPGCGLPLLRVTIEEGGIIANELEHLDAVLNSARSAGVVIRASFQRAHHAVVDTNVRGAFGSTMSFGCKNTDDIFAMPDELLHAGANPSQWADRQPGMLYWSAGGIDFERQLMPLRSFKIEANVCTETIAAHVATRDAWIRENCPDWFALLEDLDEGRGAYSKRTTGAMVLADMEAAQARKAGRAAPEQPAAQEPNVPQRFAGTGTDDEAQVIDMAGWPRHTGNGHGPLDEEPVDAEIIDRQPPPWGQPDDIDIDEDNDEDDEMLTLADLDLTPEQLNDMAEDRGIDPRSPIPEVRPEDDYQFPPREPGVTMTREEALAATRGYLAVQGVGWEFRPRDLYPALCGPEKTGKSPEWIRATALPALLAEGLLSHDRLEGRYTVLDKIRDAS